MRPSGQKGFTIIEVAMVLVIIGLIVGFGASLVGPLTMRAKRNETKETIQAAVEAIIGFAASNNQRLPNDAEFRALLRKQNDAFSKPLYYVFDSNLISAGSICNRKTTFITVQEPTPSIQNVAFMVLSSGENFNNQTTGDRNASAAVTINVFDIGTAGIDNYATDMNRPEEYDDLYQMVTLNEIRTKTRCQGPPLQILNNELPSTSLGSIYTANVFATGGVPNVANQYRWCVEIRNRTVAQGLPNGITFNPSFIRYPNDPAPTYCSDQAETAWPAWANNLVINKTAASTESGSFNVTVFSRDNNNPANDTACNATSNRDSCAQKSFVITINNP